MFIENDCIMSNEGTTQGDPLAMGMYAIATIPLITRLNHLAKQVWYADDAAACDSLSRLRQWWDLLTEIGPSFGYFPNALKTHLLVKPEFVHDASVLFADTSITISSDGHRYLGSVIGSDQFVSSYVKEQVVLWQQELHCLSVFAESQPHASFTVLTHGLISKWSFLSRTTPNIGVLLEPLEITIRSKLIPAMLGCSTPDDVLRDLFSLPARLGGLGIVNPVLDATYHYDMSREISSPLVDLITQGVMDYSFDTMCRQLELKEANVRKRDDLLKEKVLIVDQRLSDDLRFAVLNGRETGASSWLTVVPMKAHGFALHKGDFQDAIALRYGWVPSRLPLKCVCGSTFTVEHAMSCSHGGLPSHRHNELRDLTASLLAEVCTDVKTEPDLQPLTGESMHHRTAVTTDEARLDVRAQGFWGSRFTRDYFDVKVFNPLARSYKNKPLRSTYGDLERLKRRSYEQRVREIEHGTFTPLIFSASGGLGKAAHLTYRRLASLLSAKWNEHYNIVIRWLRCRISFSLLRSAISCLRSSRSTSKLNHLSISLVAVESKL